MTYDMQKGDLLRVQYKDSPWKWYIIDIIDEELMDAYCWEGTKMPEDSRRIRKFGFGFDVIFTQDRFNNPDWTVHLVKIKDLTPIERELYL